MLINQLVKNEPCSSISHPGRTRRSNACAHPRSRNPGVGSNGLAGARTERIAEAAGVNKALIYYYFQGKEALYIATLEFVAERMAAVSMKVLTLGVLGGRASSPLHSTTLTAFILSPSSRALCNRN